jgi:hypothetical protein
MEYTMPISLTVPQFVAQLGEAIRRLEAFPETNNCQECWQHAQLVVMQLVEDGLLSDAVLEWIEARPRAILGLHGAPFIRLLKRLRNNLSGTPAEGLFKHDGKPYLFPSLQWRLIQALHGKESVAVEDVIEAVYPGESDEADGKFRKLQHDTNNTFLEHRLPYEIQRPMSGYISLNRIGL